MKRWVIVLVGAVTLVASATATSAAPKSGSGGSRRPKPLIATRIPTVDLTATAIVARLTETATGAGLDGKAITFSFPNSLEDSASIGMCVATTRTRTPPSDPTSVQVEAGWAECQLDPAEVLAASFKRITASFAGDGTYAATSTAVTGYVCTGDEPRTCLIST